MGELIAYTYQPKKPSPGLSRGESESAVADMPVCCVQWPIAGPLDETVTRLNRLWSLDQNLSGHSCLESLEFRLAPLAKCTNAFLEVFHLEHPCQMHHQVIHSGVIGFFQSHAHHPLGRLY